MTSIVVADAGPLHYLVLVDSAGILGNLFDQVLIPIAVRDELFHLNTPETVKAWIHRQTLPNKCQFSLFKLDDGGGRILANS